MPFRAPRPRILRLALLASALWSVSAPDSDAAPRASSPARPAAAATASKPAATQPPLAPASAAVGRDPDSARGRPRPLLWTASLGGRRVHLFGSIHLLRAPPTPLPPAVEAAWKEARILAVEVDTRGTASGRIQRLFQEKGFYPADSSLRTALAPEDFEAVSQALAERGLPDESFLRMRPWMVALTLSMLDFNKLGFDAAQGVDRHFLESAGTRRVVELESAQAQVEMLAGLDGADGADFLRYTLAERRLSAESASVLEDSWRQGDSARLDSLVFAPLRQDSGLARVYDRILFDRNEAMAARIASMLRSPETEFVVIGAGHLVGDRGVIALLRSRGVEIARP